MKYFLILLLILSLFINCSKDPIERTSAFSGILLNDSNNQSIDEGVINILGFKGQNYAWGSTIEGPWLIASSITEPDGSFDFEATIPQKIEWMRIEVAIPWTAAYSETECRIGSPGACSVEPGKDYRGLRLRAIFAN